MKFRSLVQFLIVSLGLTSFSQVIASGPKDCATFLSYHWHLHQPIYWPAPNRANTKVQTAAESFDIKATGGGFYNGSNVPHPQNNLATGDIGSYDPIFSKDDRVQVYQFGGKDSIATLGPHPHAGASVSYSGSLMDNVQSWASSSRHGYFPNWNLGYAAASRWKTPTGGSKAEMVGFTYHHSLAPLIPPSVLKKEIQLMKAAQKSAWGQDFNTRGFFPPEVAFSQSMIPILKSEGFDWVIVANGHLARSTKNYLDADVAPNPSNSTWNTNPPNRADQLNPAIPANQWWSGTIDGRGAKVPAPFAYQAHWIRYVDPETGVESKIVAVPMDEVLSYMNGYGTMGTQIIDKHIAPLSSPARPSLVLMAHDGDNAWAGGNSYYFESVHKLADEAVSKGYQMAVIADFLQKHPVPAENLVHIEDGGWVNPEGDWGDPQFVKWLYPPARSPNDSRYNPKDPRTFIDIENGFSASWRSWAVIIAGANLCETAEQLTGAQNISADRIRNPENGANAAEKAWHYYLSGLDSGFMYYGDSLDDEVKQSLAVNHSYPHAMAVIGDAAADKVGPNLLKPQRWPHNPGGMGWGVTTKYQRVGIQGAPPYSSDFYVWTLGFDVSGIKDAILKFRVSKKGERSVNDSDHLTYKGGSDVGDWISVPMNRRKIDPDFKGDPANPNLNFFIQPKVIADHFWAKIEGFKNVFVDYMIEAQDEKGNVTRSEIGHVWVGNGS